MRHSASFHAHAFSTAVGLSSTYTLSACATTIGYRLSPWHPLADIPGPRLWRITSLWLSWVSWKGRRYLILDRLHAKYGPYLRIGEPPLLYISRRYSNKSPGPDTISVNSQAAQYIYSASAHMPKSESYRAPGHKKQVALFFKQPTEKLHSDRKRVWQGLFTKEG